MNVLLCPGQGAQYPGMGKALAERFPAARAVFERADEVLGFDLTRTVFEGTAEDVERTDVCQPAILTVTAAIVAVLKEHGALDPSQLRYTLGLSLGEYTAHLVAGSLSFDDAVSLVRKRGQLMQAASDATPSGMAAAIGPSPDDVEAVCAGVRDEGGVVVVANLNAPGQVVVSGEAAALELCCARLTEAGARRVIPLKVAGAFHSPVMQPAADALRRELEQVSFSDPAVPVVCNVTGRPVTTADEARETLASQIVSPVYFERSLRFVMEDVGDELALVEPGPGKALTGFVRKIERRARVTNAENAEDVIALVQGES